MIIMVWFLLYNIPVPYMYVLYTVCSDDEIEKLLRTHPNIMNHWTKHSKKLNEIQREALCCALKYRFQLIQGPPGQCFDHIHCF